VHVLVPSRGLRVHEWELLSLVALAGVMLAVAGATGGAWQRVSVALELLYPHFPGPAAPGTAWPLLVARFLLPLVATYATLRFLTSFYAQRLWRLRVRRLRGHAVVYGLSDAGLRAVRTFARERRRVVAIRGDATNAPIDEALAAGATVLLDDASLPDVLGAAGAARADVLVCALEDEAANIGAALSARDLAAPQALAVYARVARSELVELLDGAAVECFDLDDIWARNLLEAGPLARRSVSGEPPRLIVVGSGGLARAVVVNAARQWHFHARETGSNARLAITLVGPDAAREIERIATRCPAARRTSMLEAVHWEPAGPLALSPLTTPDAPLGVYLCLADEPLNLALAQLARRQLASVPAAEILVAIGRGGRSLPGALDALQRGAPLVAVAPEHAVDGFRLERFGRREQLARALYGVYANEARRAAGRETTAVAAFDQLSPDERQHNRTQADAIPDQLRAVLLAAVPIADWDDTGELAPVDIEVTAQLEHLRWAGERLAAGWRHGTERDAAARLHPDLLPWQDLGDDVRELNRVLVRRRPSLLGRIGQGIAHDTRREALARGVHERYREELGVGAPWTSLPEDERGTSRAFVSALPAALIAAGMRIDTPGTGEPVRQFAPDELETLARSVHEAWTRHRVDSGWARGSERSDTRLRHPDIVSWETLPEARRDIDRGLATAVPALLEAQGLVLRRLDDIWRRAGASTATRPSATA
jgi:hypothetical protein